MAEDLLRQLQLLEDDYPHQPLVAQKADLREINQLRSQLGLPLVDSQLNEMGRAAVEDQPTAKPAEAKPEGVLDHTQAREIYQAYLQKMEVLERHQAYADEVARATEGRGQTPVRPLATMGTNGGPLLCDHCGKPILLEGGTFHGLAADAAWKKNPSAKWSSWILGGMVVEMETNGTLRIYHGYPGRHNDCCELAVRAHKEALAKFDAGLDAAKLDSIQAFVELEFPDMTAPERLELFDKIINTMFSYDPGLGINRPSG